ncbi:MAG: hypothetical protein IPG08_10670 [Sphingobacteriaceae bacterium]|nr:hypothetical protein [Sphingobacteriaceae bacterium]
MVGQEYLNNFGYKIPEDEKTQRNRFLDGGIDYLVTRDKRIKKDVGVAYKTYFIYPQNILVKCDSVFYADKSDDELPERVFNIDQNKFTGIITRFSSEPLQSDIKLNYFRYNYIDINKSVKRVRFQTENGKLNSFSPERSFKIGDTIIHLTRRKSDYRSSIFYNDTIKLRYPLNDSDTLKFNSITCENLAVGPKNFFGFNESIFMNEKLNDLFLVGEQSTLTKSGAGLVPMEHPEAGVKGYALTKLFVIKNNGVRSINRIMVPNFSKGVSTYTIIRKDNDQVVYLLNLTSPVFLIVDNKGNVRLKDAGKPGFEKIGSELTAQSMLLLDGVKYQLLKETKSGKWKLIPFVFS